MAKRLSSHAGFVAAGVCAGTLALLACEPDATPGAKATAEKLTAFYTHYSIRGGWGLFGATAKQKNVELAINIPDQQASDLQQMDAYARANFIGQNACPPTSFDAWSQLDPDGDIIVQARRSGNVFAKVSCKHPEGGPL